MLLLKTLKIVANANRTGFEVFTAVKIQVCVFWVVTPCGVAVEYRRFGGSCCLHLQGSVPKCQRSVAAMFISNTTQNGVTTQKISIYTFCLLPVSWFI